MTGNLRKKAGPPKVSSSSDSHKYTNRLAGEKSPYLLQHAHNPVDWYPWGGEAIGRAKAENKPIFLSIGYATCHWCHVMEHESFETEEVGEALRQNFISIKVDREERPDIDQIYMSAVQALTGRGGWPMSMFLTPDLKPFWGGTYFQKPVFLNVLAQISDVWKREPEKIGENAKQMYAMLQQMADSRVAGGQPTTGEINENVLAIATAQSAQSFDPEWGGFGGAPKFPRPAQLRLLLRIARRTGDQRVLSMVTHTCLRMAAGGIYDHVGGGFARYSVDERWEIPHFEKMLYDNAGLATTYLETFQLTKNPIFAQVARETLDYVLRDMTHPDGAFYSAEDADSEGHEGKFYVWSDAELKGLLAKDEYDAVAAHFDVSEHGNFEGSINLMLRRPEDFLARAQGKLAGALRKLFDVRVKRIRPLLDDKVLTSWNGLMIGAMARGYQALGDGKYLKAAQRAVAFIRKHLFADGRLKRRWRAGEAAFAGTLDDYAYLIEGLLQLGESDPSVYPLALELQNLQDELFWDSVKAGYYYTDGSDPTVLVRTKQAEDEAVPNPNGVSALNLLKIYHLTFDENRKRQAERMFEAFGGLAMKYPAYFSALVQGFDFWNDEVKEVVIAGKPDDPATRKLIDAVFADYYPNKVVVLNDGTSPLKLATGKTGEGGKPAAYVCMGNTCLKPTSDPAELTAQLRQWKVVTLRTVAPPEG